MTTNSNTDDTTTDSTTDDSEPPPAVLEGLADAAVPLSTTDPTAPLDDLAAFGDAVADAEIVGLGEATHGSREFFELKARLIRYCVEELGTRTVCIEANVGETLTADEYVVDGEGTPEEALEAMYFWTWKAVAVRELLEWLRAFNVDRKPEDRVRFYGFDTQYTHGPTARLRESLERIDPELLSASAADLDRIDDDGTSRFDDESIPERVAAAERALPRIRDRLAEPADDDDRAALSSARRHLAALEHAVAIRAIHGDADPEAIAESEGGVTDDVARRREHAMVDGIDRLHERVAEDEGPLVCWAHDGHVAAGAQPVGGEPSPTMGARLRERYGDDYRPLGFTFERGGLRAVGEVPPAEVDDADEEDEVAHDLRTWTFDGPLPGTVDAAVGAAVGDLALLDCRTAASDDRLADWLTTERPHHSVGAAFDPEEPAKYTQSHPPGEAFDLLVHVAETTPSRPLDED